MNRLSFAMMCACAALFSLSASLPSSGCNGDETTCASMNTCKYETGASPFIYNRCIAKNEFGRDIIFLIDSSETIGNDFNQAKKFVKESIKLLNVNGDDISRFGLIVFSQLAETQYSLSSGYQNAIDAVDSLTAKAFNDDLGTSKYTLNGIRSALSEFRSATSSSKKKILVLVTDNGPDGPRSVCVSGGDVKICGACDGMTSIDGNVQMSTLIASEKVNVVNVYMNQMDTFSNSLVDCLDVVGDMKVYIPSDDLSDDSKLAIKIGDFVDSLSYYISNGLSARRLMGRLDSV